MNEIDFFKGSHNPVNLFRSLHFDSVFYQNNPDYFHPDGIYLFAVRKVKGNLCRPVRRFAL